MSSENSNPISREIDALPVAEVLRIMHNEDRVAVEAVEKQLQSIECMVEDAVSAVRSGGRVIYAGAGTSGRLGVLDASEIPPTFSSNAFDSKIAGGEAALLRAIEGAEDNEESGIDAASDIDPNDMAVGISASGTTPFVLSFLSESKKRGAKCWLITCSDIDCYPFLDDMITLLTGPEVIAGSTRLKAATATKLVLNMLSTATMVELGGVYDGLMIDVAPTNRKLVNRAERIITQITGCPEEDAARYLELSGMRAKVAVVMIKKDVSKEEAESLLKNTGGSLRKILSS
jgi:N-acetylmuramic acid 6-phosphate etherase